MTDVAVARTTDPETSHEAAASLSPAVLGKIQTRVWGLFKFFGNMTDDECVRAYRRVFGPVNGSTVRTRRKELERYGRVARAGEATTASGRRSVVWCAR